MLNVRTYLASLNQSLNQRKSDLLSSESGFTLVELMIVVAIIGILASVAVPNFQKYQAKAKQVEAKTMLAGALSAEKAFLVENSGYTHCLNAVGFGPDSGKRFYTVGFTQTAGNNCGPNGSQSCLSYSWNSGADGVITVIKSCEEKDGETFFLANTKAGGTLPGASDMKVAGRYGSVSGPTTIYVWATGNLSGTKFDHWSINGDKSLTNEQIGF